MKVYQHELLGELLDEYMHNMPQQIAEVRQGRVVEAGEPHYYRIQSSTFLVEYDDKSSHATL